MDDGNQIVTCLMKKKRHIRLLYQEKKICSLWCMFSIAWTYHEQKIHCTIFAIFCMKHHSNNKRTQKTLIVFKSKLVTSLFTVHVL